jgi:uncharacterized protein (TIGR00266 family)
MQYQIIGEPMPVVECQLQAGEAMKTESGSMVWMTPNMHMQTNAGSLGKAIGRMFSGESIFQNIYTAQGSPGSVTFGSSFPGSIRAIQVSPSHSIICQKRAFLASEMGVELSVFFQKKLGVGIFGGEGFIMQKLTGNGTVFLEIDGFAVEYDLAPSQSLLIDTGAIALMDETCSIAVEMVKGVKNIVFGGEGLTLTRITGPGKIVLQTMTVGSLASTLAPYFSSGSK